MNQTSYAFDNQKAAWAEVESLVAHNSTIGKLVTRVVLLAQPQVGKTGFMIWGAIQRLREAKRLGSDCLTIIAIADSNNALRDQTMADLMRALELEGLQSEAHKFIVEHRTNLQHLPLPEKGMLTVFVDEAHIAARVDGGRDKFQRRIYDYAETHGCLYVDVGATSFAHIALHEDAHSPYDKVVQLEPGPAYNSIQHMYDMGRIQQVEKLATKDGVPTDFLRRRMATLKRHGGYSIMRATGKRHTALLQALRALSVEVGIIECDMNKTAVVGTHVDIAALPQVLCERPKRPTVVLIRGALRVGIVIPPAASNYICEFVDTNAVRADTVTQSLLGRSCGYHKRNDRYVIYTNLKDVEVVLDFYNNVPGAIPLGLKNTGAKRTGRYEVVEFTKAHERIQTEGLQVSRCSLNNENDVADHVRRNVNTWEGRLVLIDKPNGNYSESWQLLVAFRPELIGNYVMYNPNKEWYSGAEIDEEFIDLAYMDYPLEAEDDAEAA